MDVTILPRALSGSIPAIASKSMAHRMLICASLCPSPTDIACDVVSADIDATATCLEALGASCRYDAAGRGFRVEPLPAGPDGDGLAAAPGATLDCGESGSTERFLLPLVCALGTGAVLEGHGRLPERPLSPLYELLATGGCALSAPRLPLRVSGRLRPGGHRLRGDVSSQFASGLLMAAPLLGGPFELLVSEPVASRPYIDVTTRAMALFGVRVEAGRCDDDGRPATRFVVSGSERYRSPGACAVEGDWSNAAFWLVAGSIAPKGVSVSVTGLDSLSAQGDRAVSAVLAKFGATVGRARNVATVAADRLDGADVACSDMPDLVMPLAVAASLAHGASRLSGCGRLRLKESDRLDAVADVLARMGAKVRIEGDDLVFEGVGSFRGACVDSHGDHRIAMMAAVAATRATGPVTITHAECVAKSYPRFFDDLALLGGIVLTRED